MSGTEVELGPEILLLSAVAIQGPVNLLPNRADKKIFSPCTVQKIIGIFNFFVVEYSQNYSAMGWSERCILLKQL